MKTTTILSAISLALIFSTATFATSAPVNVKNPGTPGIRGIQHHVNINVSGEQQTCNLYLVEILDGKGKMVAPAQAYVAGKTSYDFFERGPAEGVRVAVLVLGPANSHFICDRELFTTPVILKGTFFPGATYRYDLYPKNQPYKE